jgi:hypothetical protein
LKDVRIDDAVKMIRGLLAKVGEKGDVGDDEIADAVEDAVGDDKFRVDLASFRKAFHTLVGELGLSLPRELPKAFGVCFFEAARPRDRLSSRVAARVLIKVWRDLKAKEAATTGVEGGVAVSGGVVVGGDEGAVKELDAKEVRAVLRGCCAKGEDELGVVEFEKAARQVIFDEAPEADDMEE